MPVAIIAITGNGARLGATLQRGIAQSSLFVIEKHAAGDALSFSERVPELMARMWPEYEGFVMIMATGIVVRTIAPLLQGKESDPAVVVMDDAGRFAISLLSGHLGGANRLAETCAALTASIPVITTATDANGLPSFDMLALDNGWHIEDLSRVRVLNALLLEGKEIAVVDPTGRTREYFAGKGRLSFFMDIEAALACDAGGFLLVSNRVLPSSLPLERTLVLRPVDLFLGIGCNRGTSAEEIEAVVARNLATLSLSVKSVRCLASARAKEDEEGLLAFARDARLPLIFFDNAELNGVTAPPPPRPTPSRRSGPRGSPSRPRCSPPKGGRCCWRR